MFIVELSHGTVFDRERGAYGFDIGSSRKVPSTIPVRVREGAPVQLTLCRTLTLTFRSTHQLRETSNNKIAFQCRSI